MYEAVVTLVLTEQGEEPGDRVPYTKVLRYEFDTRQALEDWLRLGVRHVGTTAAEELHGEPVGETIVPTDS